MVRMVISGVQSSGKSTLLENLENHFNKSIFIAPPSFIAFIKEPIRNLIATEGITINKGADFSSQMRILNEHYNNTFKYSYFITDRGAIDSFVYAQYGYLNGKFSNTQFELFENIFLRTISRYSHFVYIQSAAVPTQDGVRDIDPEYIRELERLYKLTYDTYLKDSRLIFISNKLSRIDRVHKIVEEMLP